MSLTRRGFFGKLIAAVVAAPIAAKAAPELISWDIETTALNPWSPYAFYGGFRGGKTWAMKAWMHGQNYGMDRVRFEDFLKAQSDLAIYNPAMTRRIEGIEDGKVGFATRSGSRAALDSDTGGSEEDESDSEEGSSDEDFEGDFEEDEDLED